MNAIKLTNTTAEMPSSEVQPGESPEYDPADEQNNQYQRRNENQFRQTPLPRRRLALQIRLAEHIGLELIPFRNLLLILHAAHYITLEIQSRTSDT